MDRESKGKILGAFVVGFALVGGAYTMASFSAPGQIEQAAAVAQPAVAERQAISVVDADNNGIEDWRDDFVSSEPVIIPDAEIVEEYVAPKTLSEQVGVDFLQGILETRIYSQNPDANEALIQDTIAELEEETSGTLYNTSDVQIIENWTPADIRNYGNVMGAALLDESIEDLDAELTILRDVLSRGQNDRIEEIAQIAAFYQRTTETALEVPVPVILLKEHLDLLNTYNAISIDIDAMTKALEDPVVTLMRLRRYEDNVLGLELALNNMSLSLAEYGNLFEATDDAVIFSLFVLEQNI